MLICPILIVRPMGFQTGTVRPGCQHAGYVMARVDHPPAASGTTTDDASPRSCWAADAAVTVRRHANVAKACIKGPLQLNAHRKPRASEAQRCTYTSQPQDTSPTTTRGAATARLRLSA